LIRFLLGVARASGPSSPKSILRLGFTEKVEQTTGVRVGVILPVNYKLKHIFHEGQLSNGLLDMSLRTVVDPGVLKIWDLDFIIWRHRRDMRMDNSTHTHTVLSTANKTFMSPINNIYISNIIYNFAFNIYLQATSEIALETVLA